MTLIPHTGDDGNTSLIGPGRVPKDHQRLEALGAIEELNAQIGICRATSIPIEAEEALLRIQSELVELGREVLTRRDAPPGTRSAAPFAAENLCRLEQDLRKFGDRLDPQVEFLLPGGHYGAAVLHAARALCRKAERRVVPLARVDRISGNVLRYLNRLGTLLFILARVVNTQAGMREPVFRPFHDRNQDAL